jgi:hypothetical protein
MRTAPTDSGEVPAGVSARAVPVVPHSTAAAATSPLPTRSRPTPIA